MSHALVNTILLSETPDDTWKKIKPAVTDPLKARKGDPGRPEVCLVYTYHQKWNPLEIADIHAGCSSGALGCVDCKKNVNEKINVAFTPIREKRIELEADISRVVKIIESGEERARQTAGETMRDVRDAMKFG